MPWTAADADTHVKGLSAKQKRAWAKIANSALERCTADGRTDCDASAIRQANAAAQRIKESEDISEAATLKAQAQGLVRSLDALLADRALPDALRTNLQGARAALKRKWADLEADASTADDAPAPATEAARLLTEASALLEADLSHDQARVLLQAAVKADVGGGSDTWVWIRDVYDDYLIYSVERPSSPDVALYKRSYSLVDGTVTLGDAQKVQAVTSYVAVAEAARDEDSLLRRVGASITAAIEAAIGRTGGDPPGETLLERRFTADQRTAMAAKGHALPDGSFPIATVADLENAIRAIGRASDPAAARAHIRKRAKALGALDKLPADWKESAGDTELTGDLVPLVEKAVRRDGTVPLKLIRPGWGSSGYYDGAVLKRDGPKVFAKGTKMYWDHPTPTEEAERPERSLRDLAAELVSDARWEDEGAAGAGLYADAKVFGGFTEAIEELAPHIGVSIRALGRATAGEAEGRSGPVIESLVAAKSVDFVTAPGAGGQILSLFEAARGRAIPHGGDEVTEEEATRLREATTALGQQLQEAQTKLARMEEAAILTSARELASATLTAISGLPEPTVARLVASEGARPIVKDGALDREPFVTRVRESAAAELEYLQSVGGLGAIRGMGGSAGAAAAVTVEEADKQLETAFIGLLGESAGKLAARGRG